MVYNAALVVTTIFFYLQLTPGDRSIFRREFSTILGLALTANILFSFAYFVEALLLPFKSATAKSFVRIPILIGGTIFACWVNVTLSRRAEPVTRNFTRISICEGLSLGVTRNELESALGPAGRGEDVPQGEMLTFESDLGAAGPIHAIVGPDGRVLMLKCNEDGPARWMSTGRQ